MTRPYREWTPDDTATLRRMRGAGYSDAITAEHMGRDRAYIVRKAQEHHIPPGITAAHIAALSRANMRRRMAA